MENFNKNAYKKRDVSELSPADCHAIILNQDAVIQELSQRLNWFEEQFKLLRHKRFSTSSEKHNPQQLSLFDEGDINEAEDNETAGDELKETITYTRTKLQPHRNSKNIDTTHLPRSQHIIDLSEEEKQCPCGCRLEKVGEDIKEEIEHQRATLKVIEHIRIKYTCRACETMKAPAAVELPILKSKASAGLLTEVILNKYQFHLPLYRQSRMLASLGITVPDNTLGGWIMKSAEQLLPLSEALWKELSRVRALQVDETPVKLLKPEKKAYMWLYHSYLPGQRFVIFDFNSSRSGDVVNERLKCFQGILQTDGYSGYNTQRKRTDIISLGCWDHARRKFKDVVKANGEHKAGKAGDMLEKIAKLYAIESDIKNLTPEERKSVRQQRAIPILNFIHGFLHKINAPPKSLLGVAVTYCKNQWVELTRYVEYGEAQLSNCWIENQVRPFAVGKRNWLFVGNELSARRGALLYSLIQSCELNNIEPREYLIYVLNQVHRMRRQEVDPITLLPHTIDQSLLSNN